MRALGASNFPTVIETMITHDGPGQGVLHCNLLWQWVGALNFWKLGSNYWAHTPVMSVKM